MKLHLPSVRSVPWRSLPVLVVILVACAGLSRGDSVSVDCSTGTVQAALNSLPPITPSNPQNAVTITGQCAESILVSGFTNLTISAGSGGATLNPGPSYALRIDKSDQVYLNGLTFDGNNVATNGYPLVWVYESTRVNFKNCIFQKNGSDEGLRIDNSRDISVGPATLTGNAGAGLTMFGPSTVSLGSWDTPLLSTTVQNNGLGTPQGNSGAAGIVVSGGGSLFLAPGAIIQNNTNDGVDISQHSQLSTCCEPSTITIQNNGRSGVSASASSDLSLYAVTIQGNKTSGVSLDHSTASTWVVTIQGNGDVTQPSNSFGISLNGNSSASVMQGSVTGNYGPGVQALGGSSVMVCCGITISGNTRNGVLLQGNSNAAFWGGGQHQWQCAGRPRLHLRFGRDFCQGDRHGHRQDAMQ